MAQFDVYARHGEPLLLNCQTDLLMIDTRLVVPLRLRSGVVNLVRRLNPVFIVNGEEVVMMTPMMATVHVSTLGECVASLANEQDAIKAAIDMLVKGF